MFDIRATLINFGYWIESHFNQLHDWVTNKDLL